jgi:opacity protein-like surface antigen
MQLRRILFFILFFCFFSRATLFSQLIEKAPSSPVAVQALPTDSVNALLLVNDIIITGYKKTLPYIIQREVPLKKGQYILNNELQAKLMLCKQQLMNTSLFVDVDVRPIVIDSNNIFIDIHVKERWYLFPIPYFRIVSRNFNTWWVEEGHNFNKVEYGLKFMQNNVSGRNDNLNLWLIGGYTQQVSLRYDNPNIDNKLKHGINIGFGYRRNRELNYAINYNKQSFFKEPDKFLIKQFYVDFAYTYRPAIRTRHTFRVSYSDISVSDTVVKLNRLYLAPGATTVHFPDISYTLQYYNLDYNPYPLKGFSGEASLYKRFGKNSDVWQVSGRANFAAKLFPRSFIQLQAAGLLRFPFNQPYISNSLMGSTDLYMRGLEYYVVEGVAGGVARATVKNEIISLNVRNPVRSSTHDKIPFRVFLKAYGDLGYSFMPNFGNSILNNKLLRTWGAGVDIVTFYDVVLRLEYSFNQLGDNGLFVHTQTDF